MFHDDPRDVRALLCSRSFAAVATEAAAAAAAVATLRRRWPLRHGVEQATDREARVS